MGIFGKWSDHNVSFFEIIINGWPHMFLRAFHDIRKGDELSTEYGNAFWRTFKADMDTSAALNKYHWQRMHRVEQVKALKAKLGGKKRKDIDTVVVVESNK